MPLVYKPLNPKHDYEVALGGNAHRLAQLNAVWNRVTSIDLQLLVNRYNTLEMSANVTDLTNLKNDIETAISIVQGVKNSYSDVDVLAPANEMLMRLSTVRSNTESRIRHYTTGFGKTKLGQAMDTAKRGMTKVVKAYKKISKPADDLYRAAENAMDSGGGNIYESIGRIGKRK